MVSYRGSEQSTTHLTVRIQEDVYNKFKDRAYANDRSMRQEGRFLILEYVKNWKLQQKKR